MEAFKCQLPRFSGRAAIFVSVCSVILTDYVWQLQWLQFPLCPQRLDTVRKPVADSATNHIVPVSVTVAQPATVQGLSDNQENSNPHCTGLLFLTGVFRFMPFMD
jgi:hypothetical protein